MGTKNGNTPDGAGARITCPTKTANANEATRPLELRRRGCYALAVEIKTERDCRRTGALGLLGCNEL
eukprot:6372011-Lingulodinium_polyedra.AAC.1